MRIVALTRGVWYDEDEDFIFVMYESPLGGFVGEGNGQAVVTKGFAVDLDTQNVVRLGDI